MSEGTGIRHAVLKRLMRQEIHEDVLFSLVLMDFAPFRQDIIDHV